MIRGVDDATLERELGRIRAAGRAAWPGVVLDDEVLVAHIATHLASESDVAKALAGLHAADLYLACAAARGLPAAVERVRALLVAEMPTWLSSLRLDAARLDEVLQTVVTRLLVARPDGPPRIAEYGGRGPLGGWLRVIAVRTALNQKAAERPQDVVDDDLPDKMLGPAGADVEMDIVRQFHREDFAAAFRQALESLEPRDRTLLGLHWLDGVPTTKLGEMYGVHRTSVGRWLEEAQERVLAATKTNLAERVGVSPEEADSLIRLMRSRLDVSLRLLRQR